MLEWVMNRLEWVINLLEWVINVLEWVRNSGHSGNVLAFAAVAERRLAELPPELVWGK